MTQDNRPLPRSAAYRRPMHLGPFSDETPEQRAYRHDVERRSWEAYIEYCRHLDEWQDAITASKLEHGVL